MSGAGLASDLFPAPFIVGVGRSGTTLLRLMLDAHPDLAIPGETHFVPALIDVVERTGDRDQALQTLLAAMSWPNLGLEPQAMASAFACQEPFSPGAAIRAVFALYAARLGKPRWGDKTPTYRRSIIEIARAVPEARFIHIIRDGRDVALSYRGLWFGPGDDLDAQARFWTAEITEARRQAVEVAHYMELHYEGLVHAPEPALRRICEFLELPFHPAMLAYDERARGRLAEYVQTFGPQGAGQVSRKRFLAIHDRTHAAPDASRIGRWRTQMTQAEQAAYEDVAGPMLADLGYALSR